MGGGFTHILSYPDPGPNYEERVAQWYANISRRHKCPTCDK